MPIALPPFVLPWAMLDHDTRHTGHSNAVGPYDPSVLGLPWPYKTGGAISSSPSIDYTGTAYVGSKDGWLHSVAFNGRGIPLFKTNSPIQASPALIEDTLPLEGIDVPPPVIYFGSDNGQLFSILPTGKLRWALAPGTQPNQSPVRSSPVIAQLSFVLRRVYVGADNGLLYGIFETSPTSVTTAWEITTAPPLRTSPALSPLGDRLYVGAFDGILHCLNAFTGTPLPNTPITIGGGPLTTPIVDPVGKVYVANATGTIFAFDSSGGGIWQVSLGSNISAPPTLGVSGEVLAIADDTLYALSAAGNILWNQAFPSHHLQAAAPVVDSAGTAYVASTDGWVFGVRRHPIASGSRLLWSVQVDPAGPTLTTPALDAHGRVYVGASDSQLYVIDEVPAFQVAFHSNLSATTNIDVHSLRETYGALDPARTLRLTDDPALDQQPAYSLDRSVITYVSDRGSSKDVFLATAIATDEENLTGPGSTFPPISTEAEPAFTPIDDLRGFSRPPHLKPYLALTSNQSGLNRLIFIDLEAQASGVIVSQSFTDWATSLGVPGGITPLLEPPNTEQSQIAFAIDGKKMAWRHCEPTRRIGEIRLLIIQGATWQLTSVGPTYYYNPESRIACGDEPCFSPDSRWIVVREGPSLAIYDVFSLLPPVFSRPKSPFGEPTHPNWAPDGSEIAVGLNTGTAVDLFVASGKGYGTFSQLTSSRTSDEPYYHYFKMPPPQPLRLGPNQQFPGATIEILGRGFDIIHPQNNKVFFTDTQHRLLREAQVLSATVDPYEGLGVLSVRVPDFAGHGPITVETRFGSSTTPEFHVLPKPARVVQARSVPRAKVRIFGLGFDLSPAKGNTVSFTAATGGFVAGTTISGGLDGAEEFLVVEVPIGVAESGPIRVDNIFGGAPCTCVFTQLHPTVSLARTVNSGLTTGLPEYALQGSAGVMVRLEGTNFPFDPFFGFGINSANINVETLVAAIAPIPIGTFPFAQDGPDTAKFGSVTFPFPNLPALIPGYPGGDLRINASDVNLPAANTSAPFRIPLTNIPIIFIPGTSGSSLDIAFGIPQLTHNQQADSHGPFSFQQHSSHTFTYHPASLPGNDPRGARVWIGPEATRTILDPINTTNFNLGNHYLDAIGFDVVGNPLHPEIVPGTVLYDMTFDNPLTGVRMSIPLYKPLIDFLTRPNPLDPVGWPGRPLCNGLNPTLPTTGAETCFDVSGGINGAPKSGHNAVYLFNLDWRNSMPKEAQRLSDFIDTVLARQDVPVKKVVLITHSYGGPVVRWYYLDPDNRFNHPEQKVDQVISIGGGFHGVPKPVDVLEEGSDWGFGFNWGPVSIGIATWETQALAQNWPTSYYQMPNSELWFWDHGTFRTGITSPTLNKINRAFIRDFRSRVSTGFTGPGEITSYAKSMDWIGVSADGILGRTRHNIHLTLEAVTKFTPRPGFIGLGNFMTGTGAIYHHRIIGKGQPDTIVGTALYTRRIQYQNQIFEFDVVEPVHGDGDSVVPYWGSLGLTDARDDRVYILDKGEHFELTKKPQVLGDPVGSPAIIKGLLQLLIEGSICSQPQVPPSLNFLSQNQVTEIV